MSKILTQAQAEAAYSAMCALNNVSISRMSVVIPGKDASGRSTCTEMELRANGFVVIEVSGYNLDRREAHETQSAFATAYGLAKG